MYNHTVEEEIEFVNQLWHIFTNWAVKKDYNSDEPGSEIIECDIICPKCGKGKIINYGITSINHNNRKSYGMKHICNMCHERFDRIKINEDIYNNTPYEIKENFDTPLGKFQVLRNGETFPFRYRIEKICIKGIEICRHFIDIDTSTMNKGDKVFAGIIGAGLEYFDGDERCSYRSAENDDIFLILNGEEIDEFEVDINDYSFITENADENGYHYLIHRDPNIYINNISHSCRVITLTIAWERKDICDGYEDVIELATG